MLKLDKAEKRVVLSALKHYKKRFNKDNLTHEVITELIKRLEDEK